MIDFKLAHLREFAKAAKQPQNFILFPEELEYIFFIAETETSAAHIAHAYKFQNPQLSNLEQSLFFIFGESYNLIAGLLNGGAEMHTETIKQNLITDGMSETAAAAAAAQITQPLARARQILGVGLIANFYYDFAADEFFFYGTEQRVEKEEQIFDAVKMTNFFKEAQTAAASVKLE